MYPLIFSFVFVVVYPVISLVPCILVIIIESHGMRSAEPEK